MFWIISFFYFFYFSIIGLHIIFIPKLLSTLSYSSVEIGYIYGAAPLVRFLVPLFFIKGFRLNDTTFYTALVILGLSIIGIYKYIDSFYPLLFSNILFGTGLSLLLPYVELISLDTIGKEKYGRSRLFGSFGFMLVALVLVKFLNPQKDILLLLLFSTFMTIVFGYITVKLSKTSHLTKKIKTENKNIFKDIYLWMGFVFLQMSFGSFYNFFTIYETDRGISLEMTVYLWSFGVAVEIVMLFFQGRLLQKNLLSIMQLCVGLTVLRWLLVFLFSTNVYVLFLSQSLHAFSFALFHSASISYLFHRYSNKPLAQQLFSGLSYGLGGLVGSVVAGYIYHLYPDYLFLSSAFFAFVAFVFIVRFKTQI